MVAELSVVRVTVAGVPEGRVPSVTTAALLWDLDNVSVPRDDMASLAQTLSGLVEPGAPRVAAANWRMFRLSRSTLQAHGIRVICGGRDPAGADGVLLRQARRLRKRGVGRFLVVSNDHVFARIAATAEVHVITLTGPLLSGRLRAVAGSVTVLSRDGAAWRAEPPTAQPPAATPGTAIKHMELRPPTHLT